MIHWKRTHHGLARRKRGVPGPSVDGKSEESSDETVADEQDGGVVGLHGADADEALAWIAAAERSAGRDWLPVALLLACLALLAISATGVVQTSLKAAKEAEIHRRMNRPMVKPKWSVRVGATRENLGLPPLQKDAGATASGRDAVTPGVDTGR
jgi:hypothetical protein